MRTLKGKYGDVDLRNPLGQFGKVTIIENTVKEIMQNEDQSEHTIKMYEILKSFSIYENEELMNVLEASCNISLLRKEARNDSLIHRK